MAHAAGSGNRPGFSSQTIKLGIAVIAASVGVVLAVRGLIPTRSERTEAPKPRIVTADGSAPAPQRQRSDAPRQDDLAWIDQKNAESEQFEPVKSADTARALLSAAATTINAVAQADFAARGELGSNLAAFLTPVFSGEGEIADAIAGLGGDTTNSTRGLEGLLGTLLRYASIDSSGIRIREIKEEPVAMGGISASRNREASTDDAGETTTTETLDIMLTTQTTFPAAIGDGARGPMLEVAIPLRTTEAKGPGRDATLILLTRWNQSAGAWQPARIQLRTSDTSAMDRVMKALRTSEPQDGGG